MKSARLLLVGLFLVAFSSLSHAESAPPRKEREKSPADQAADDFFKLMSEREAKQDQARFQKVIAAGMGFVVAHPAHRRTLDVINALSSYGVTALRGKGQGPLQASFLSLLEYQVLDYRLKEGLSEEARTAIATVECAVASIRVRALPNKENLESFREKIDTMAIMPGSSRFLDSQERSYSEVLRYIKPASGEAHLQKLLEHHDKKVAAMAREELNLVEVNKAPLDLKFTAMDGREVDLAQLRGKVVLLWFWSPKARNADREHDGLRVVRDTYAKRGFEVIGIACSKESDREAVVKFVKDHRVAWPQHFDGKETKGELTTKLNVHNVPAAYLLDQKGMLVGGKAINPDALDPTVKRLLGVK